MEGRSWSHWFLLIFAALLIYLSFFPFIISQLSWKLFTSQFVITLVLLVYGMIKLDKPLTKLGTNVIGFLGASLVGFGILSFGVKWLFLPGMIALLFSFLLLIQLFRHSHHQRYIQPILTDKPRLIFPFLLYTGILFFSISSELGNWFVPAGIFGLVLMVVCLMALNRWKMVPQKSFWLVMAGSAALLLANSLLILDVLYFQQSEIKVLYFLFYSLGQYSILTGMLEEEKSFSLVEAREIIQSRVNSSINV